MAKSPGTGVRNVLSRRSMLLLTGGLATYSFFGCGDDEEFAENPDLPLPNGDGGPDGPVVPATVFFDQLTQLRDAVRKSPDHTRARADLAVASKDANVIFKFVRDEIALLVPHGVLDRGEVGQRWGVEGVLRGGSGTYRERAELLASLLGRAGITAKVGVAPLPKVIAPEILYRRPKRVFAPAVDAAQVAAIWKAIGKTPPAPKPAFDAAGVDSKQLAGALGAIVTDGKATVLALDAPGLVPMVTVTVGGMPKLAFPYGDLELVDPGTTVVSDASPAQAPAAVHVILSMTNATGEKQSLLDASFGADALVGKQLLLRSVPAGDPVATGALHSSEVHLFVPSLAIVSAGADTTAIAPTVKVGRAITDRGDLVIEDASGLSVGGLPVSVAAPGSDGSNVVTVTVTANAAAFPAIELLVSAKDAQGKAVAPVAASAIRVSEDSVDRGFVLVENAAPKPRVLVVYDTSVSVPQAFFEDAGKTTFGQSLAQALEDRLPQVELIAVGTGGDKPAADKWTKPVPADFGESIRTLSAYGSAVWTAVRNAAAASPAVIVLLSDFQADEATDPNLPGIKASAAFGAPVVAVAAGVTNMAIQAEIASLTGGTTLVTDDPANVTAIADAVVALLAKRAAAPYRLSYHAPVNGPATRQVSVTFPKSGSKGSTMYTVPATAARVPDGGIRGLLLSVQIGDDAPITRTLAGLTPAEAVTGTPLTAAASAAIRQALLGATLISFEGGAPSVATWVDDYITGRLSTRRLYEALVSKDAARIQAAREAGFTLVPDGLEALHVPPSAGGPSDPVVMEHGLRAAIYGVSTRADGRRVHRSDILQSTTLESTAATGEAAYKQTLEASCRLALAESKVFSKSTVSLLKGVALTRLPGSSGNDVSFLPDALRPVWTKLVTQYAAFDRLVPTAGAPLAMWAIDPATGSAFGVLEDGSGGGQEENLTPPGATDEARLNQVLNAAGLFGGGPYYIIGKACARIYARAGNELTPGYVGPPVDAGKEACNLATDLAKDAFFGGLGGVGEVLSAADGVRELAGSSDPLSPC